jgi:LPS sulfotransferase NodH
VIIAPLATDEHNRRWVMTGTAPPLLQQAGQAGGSPAIPKRSYIIATAPRTGSSLLSEALIVTARAGRPDEFFDPHPGNEAHWARHYKAPEGAGYLDRIVAASSTPNGVFGCKLHWHQVPSLRSRLVQAMPVPETPDNRPTFDLLQQRLPGTRFVWLSRRNKVAQAISYYRAARSQVWHAWTDGRQPDAASATTPEFDRTAIGEFLRTVESMDVGWRRFFQHHKVPALIVIYEDFIKSFAPTVRGVLKFLDIRYDDVVVPAPSLRRLADEESEEWERRFRAGPPRPRYATAAAGDTKPAEVRGREPEADSWPMTALDVGARSKTTLVPGGPARAWMDATPRRFAYRCLPMVIANQWGWLIKIEQRVEAVWDGSDLATGLVVTSPGQDRCLVATSLFGCGVLTFHAGYLFRTAPGFNLHVRGPANWPKDGICALEGIVETDWTEATFTMNWKITRPNHKVVFEAGDPVAMISPVRRGELERFAPEVLPLSSDPDIEAAYKAWSASRNSFNAGLLVAGSPAQKAGWQRDYVRGRTTGGEPAPDHQTAIALRGFDDKRRS